MKRSQTITFVYEVKDGETEAPLLDWFSPGKSHHGRIKPAWATSRDTHLHFDVINAEPSKAYIEDEFLLLHPDFQFATPAGPSHRKYRAVVHNGNVYITSDQDNHIGIWPTDKAMKNLRDGIWKVA